ncbi:MAG: lasso peptide biosynthesis B2 protein [Pseudonocardiaceae bacterium]
MTPQYVCAPDHVSACDLGPATVLVDCRTGAVKVLTGPAARWWAELAATGDPAEPTALGAVSAQALLSQLRAAGLLVPSAQPQPWSAPGVTWCHGVAADPIRLHAWVETDSQPVAEPKSTTRYTVLRIIDGTGQRRRSPSARRTTTRPSRFCGYAARK